MHNINKPWYKKWWGGLIIIIIVFILIIAVAIGFYLAYAVKQFKNNPLSAPEISYNNLDQEIKKTIEGVDNYWLGAARPKITIVEFGDFACPLCKKSFTKIREISLKYQKDVKIIYRDFPVITEHSADLALAARCAGDQGLFWVMHDKLFINQGVSTKQEILSLVEQIGADREKFTNCFNNKKHLPAIQKDLSDGQKLKITGTPSWFINGQKVAGDIPQAIFINIIELILQK